MAKMCPCLFPKEQEEVWPLIMTQNSSPLSNWKTAWGSQMTQQSIPLPKNERDAFLSNLDLGDGRMTVPVFNAVH
ncbi:hypothetical protein LJK87_41435 [Paenibacillus sp. P25]|nr:hypothetical protein LJK87_41435 [Paenibacillus sp. P25]